MQLWTLFPKNSLLKRLTNNAFSTLDERTVDLPYFIGNNFQRADASLNKIATSYYDQIWDNVLTFNNSYGDHNITVMAGTSYRDEAYNKLFAQGLNFPTDHQQSWYINQAAKIVEAGVGDDGTHVYGLSYFGRNFLQLQGKIFALWHNEGRRKFKIPGKMGLFPNCWRRMGNVGRELSERKYND